MTFWSYVYWTAMTILLIGLFGFAVAMWRFGRQKNVDDEIWLSEEDARRRHPSSWGSSHWLTLLAFCFTAAAWVDGSVG